MGTNDTLATPQGLRERLYQAGYIADEDLASLVWMGLSLERPLLLEGEAGVGKTAIAAACARALGRPLLRLQCYEGLDLNQAVYEWNYSRQLLEIRLAELDLETSADGTKIRGRYTELVRRLHPDANGGDRAGEGRLQKVIRAYQTLRKAGMV